MKQRGQNQPFYVGVDVSKLTIDVTCINQAGENHYQCFDNTAAGFQRLNRWLQSLSSFLYPHTLFCLEHTGIYSRQLVDFLLLKGGKVWLESSLHLKRSMGLVRGKSDKIDSLRIAHYAMLNKDGAKLVSPSNTTLELLRDLLSNRKRVSAGTRTH